MPNCNNTNDCNPWEECVNGVCQKKCTPACESPSVCVEGVCKCIPNCTNRACGVGDGCGGTCGDCTICKCPPDHTCTKDGCVECKPNCQGKTCGDNGCGGSCGDCAAPSVCLCVPEAIGKPLSEILSKLPIGAGMSEMLPHLISEATISNIMAKLPSDATVSEAISKLPVSDSMKKEASGFFSWFKSKILFFIPKKN